VTCALDCGRLVIPQSILRGSERERESEIVLTLSAQSRFAPRNYLVPSEVIFHDVHLARVAFILIASKHGPFFDYKLDLR
jgi:hypothetical protein